MNLLPLPPSFKFSPYLRPSSLRCFTSSKNFKSSSFTAIFFGGVVASNIKETWIKIFKGFSVINLFFLCSSWGKTCHVVGVHRMKQAIIHIYFAFL